MKRLLVPVDGSPNSLAAVRHAMGYFQREGAVEIHLLNVQPPFPRNITRFSSARARRALQREQAEAALRPARGELDGRSIPHAVHFAVGEPGATIAETARRLRCSQILIRPSRRHALARLVEGSVTNRVLELSSVPVEVLPGEEISRLERYGLPAMLAAAVAAALAIGD
ncbi:MAG: universal stress protein [Burkholderiales bacterium]|nr:universal stress protein [Burkholderiales bacterium]